MLILTRRVGEAFLVGRDITISVVAVKGNQVRLGIDAPKDVSVFRAEIAERMRREKASLEAAENDAASS